MIDAFDILGQYKSYVFVPNKIGPRSKEQGILPPDQVLPNHTYPGNCNGCDLRFTTTRMFFTMAPLTRGEEARLSLEMNISVGGKDCQCAEFKVIQTVRRGRIKDLNAAKAGLTWDNFEPGSRRDQGSDTRTERSHPDTSWRVDSGMNPEQGWYGNPWWDESPFGEMGFGQPARYFDAPGLRSFKQAVEFYTCVVKIDEFGYKSVLGCLHWGFGIVGSGHKGRGAKNPKMFDARLYPFEVICGEPEGVRDAINQWNKVEDLKIDIW